jgi:hypothetical protein
MVVAIASNILAIAGTGLMVAIITEMTVRVGRIVVRMDLVSDILTTTIPPTGFILPHNIILSQIILMPRVITGVHLQSATVALGGRIHGVVAVMRNTNRSIRGPANI